MKNISDFDRMKSIYNKYFRRNDQPAKVIDQELSPICGVDIEIEADAFTN